MALRMGAAYDSNGYLRAFLYDSAIHDLGAVDGNESSACAINNSGAIVGLARDAHGI